MHWQVSEAAAARASVVCRASSDLKANHWPTAAASTAGKVASSIPEAAAELTTIAAGRMWEWKRNHPSHCFAAAIEAG